MINFVMGANKEDYHVKNVNIGRDVTISSYADLRIARETDSCARCGGSLKFARGIEVGHVFKLGTKYSKAMKATYLDKNGKEQYMRMGCYGIGVGRTVAAAIEQNHDENGILWPMPLAPYQVIITPVNVNDESVKKVSEGLYNSLTEKGIEVVLDDRDERAGVKFKDADLIGIPIRVTIGQKTLKEHKIEIKLRKSGEIKILNMDAVEDFLISYINEGM
jgi:prolyl-tRNA synthetase